MSPVDTVRSYIQLFCLEMGVTEDSIYSPKTGAWYFKNGSSTIELFLTNQKTLSKEGRIFLRGIAALCSLPNDIMKRFHLYKTALEINTAYLGYKLALDESRGWLTIIVERDIAGMSYEEMVTLIHDLGTWADKLDSFLQQEFAGN